MEETQVNLMLHIVWLLNQEHIISEDERIKAERLIDGFIEQ